MEWTHTLTTVWHFTYKCSLFHRHGDSISFLYAALTPLTQNYTTEKILPKLSHGDSFRTNAAAGKKNILIKIISYTSNFTQL